MIKPQIESSYNKARFATFILSFSLIGITQAIWFGIGWIILLQTIRLILFRIPQFYFPTIRLLVGEEFMQQEMIRKGKQKFPLMLNAVAILLSIALTVLFFWKINISLLDIFRMLTEQ
jgi:hypothetical protein